MIRQFFTSLFLLMTTSLVAQTTIPLYSGEIPGAKPGPDDERTEEQNGITVVHNITRPSIAVYLPEKSKATGTAVIIFPGGGYRINAIRHEGYDVAKKLNEIGIAAFVVKYRIPDDARMTDKRTGALQDAQQAITVVRKNAAKYNVKSDRIGILGFPPVDTLHLRPELISITPFNLPKSVSVRIS